MIIKGNIVDWTSRTIFSGEVNIQNGIIVSIRPIPESTNGFILPGLIDSHVHIESSMVTPLEFSRMVMPHGTVAVVSDPHEIGNVLGVEGVDYMIKSGEQSPLKFFFGAPSCVPATNFENSGAIIDSDEVEKLLSRDDIWFLSEIMNFPGVIYEDVSVMSKITAAKKFNKPIDGHAPGLAGKDLNKYVSHGISTDHECFTLEEALAKINLGMKIQIREGSAAKNFDTLSTLIQSHPSQVMLCTDDSHPDDLLSRGHIDYLFRKGLSLGYSVFDLIQVSSVNAVNHYNLPIGLLREGDAADFIVVDSLESFHVIQTYINGVEVYNRLGSELELPSIVNVINHFNCNPISVELLKLQIPELAKSIKVIDLIEGELVTSTFNWKTFKGQLTASVSEDILKLVVVNRYNPRGIPGIGFVRGFGLKKGAIAGSIAHDSHNIIAVGTSDENLTLVINDVISNKGGLSLFNGEELFSLALPIAGLMSDKSGKVVANMYEKLNREVHKMGGKLKAPFMSLSFLSLLVMPELKLSDKGLFDGKNFNFTQLFDE